jgi:hypothetical protein
MRVNDPRREIRERIAMSNITKYTHQTQNIAEIRGENRCALVAAF